MGLLGKYHTGFLIGEYYGYSLVFRVNWVTVMTLLSSGCGFARLDLP